MVLLACTLLYIFPRTSILGAILLTRYLGGAIASQVRAQASWFNVVFAFAFACLVWGGLWLRDIRVWNFLPYQHRCAKPGGGVGWLRSARCHQGALLFSRATQSVQQDCHPDDYPKYEPCSTREALARRSITSAQAFMAMVEKAGFIGRPYYTIVRSFYKSTLRSQTRA